MLLYRLTVSRQTGAHAPQAGHKLWTETSTHLRKRRTRPLEMKNRPQASLHLQCDQQLSVKVETKEFSMELAAKHWKKI